MLYAVFYLLESHHISDKNITYFSIAIVSVYYKFTVISMKILCV